MWDELRDSMPGTVRTVLVIGVAWIVLGWIFINFVPTYNNPYPIGVR